MIYCFQSIHGGSIKIGFSDNIERRHMELEAQYAQPLALLSVMEGGRDEERAIHSRFKHLRIGRSEQFRPAPELLAFIGRPLLVGPNPDAVEAMEPNRVVVIVLKDSLEYRDWLAQISEESLIPISSIVRDALAKWAKDRGYSPPPARE